MPSVPIRHVPGPRPYGDHDIDKAFTANMIDWRHYMVMWSHTQQCFVRWTWWYPCYSQPVTAGA